MSKKKPGFLADVMAKAAGSRTGYLSWFEKLPSDAQAECLAVREAFRRGELGTKAAAARAMIAAARERGWPIAAEKQVSSWLAKSGD